MRAPDLSSILSAHLLRTAEICVRLLDTQAATRKGHFRVRAFDAVFVSPYKFARLAWVIMRYSALPRWADGPKSAVRRKMARYSQQLGCMAGQGRCPVACCRSVCAGPAGKSRSQLYHGVNCGLRVVVRGVNVDVKIFIAFLKRSL